MEISNKAAKIKSKVLNLHSDFFKNNDVAINIALTGQPYDVNKEKLQLTNNEGYYLYNKNSFNYKLLNGFLMLGYYYRSYNQGTRINQHKGLLHLFQEDYGFEKSDIFIKEMLLKMDQLLSERELIYKQYANDWPLFKRISPLHPNDVSKEFIAAIYQLSNSVLPQKIQLKTEEDWFKYFNPQGSFVGDTHLPEDNPFDNIEDKYFNIKEENWFYTDNAFHSYDLPDSNFGGATKSGNQRYIPVNRMGVFLHELGHYLETEYPTFYDDEQGVDSTQKIRVETRGFHNISGNVPRDMPAYVGFWDKEAVHCVPLRPEITPYDFISYYSFSRLLGETCSSDYKYSICLANF